MKVMEKGYFFSVSLFENLHTATYILAKILLFDLTVVFPAATFRKIVQGFRGKDYETGIFG